MQLAPGERSLLAYFPSSGKARKAAEMLREAGYVTVQVDRVSRYGVNYDAEINNPISGRAETITGITLFSAGTDAQVNSDERILHASDPSVSGYGNAGYGVAGGRAFLVTVVTDEEGVDRAQKILEVNDGML